MRNLFVAGMAVFSMSGYCWTATVSVIKEHEKAVQKFGYIRGEFKQNKHDLQVMAPFKCTATLSGPSWPTPEVQSKKNVVVECSVKSAPGSIVSHNFKCNPDEDGVGLTSGKTVSLISVSCEEDEG